MLYSYPAVFVREKTGGYSVIFPDLNETATDGESLDDAIKNAIDCMAGYIVGLKEDGEPIPQASPRNAVDPAKVLSDVDDDYQEAFVNLVAVDAEEYAKAHFYKSVKKTLTIPKWLNDAAVAAGINFSGTLQEALKAKLHGA